MGSRLNNEIVCHFLYLLRLPQICSKEAFIAAKTRHPQSTQLEKPCLRQTEMRHSFRSAGSSLSRILIP